MQKSFHPTSIVLSETIGDKTRIWAFCNIQKGAVIGKNCNICDHVFIEDDVVIGDNVTVKCGVQLWNGIRIEDNVFIGPNATFANDKFPRSKKYQKKPLQTLVKPGASIGANATILPGIVIGENSMIGAGAVVTKNVPPNAIVYGNPARIEGYTNIDKESKSPEVNLETGNKIIKTKVGGVAIYPLPKVRDIRGDLTYGEYGENVPFKIKRIFMVHNVPSKEVRGEHAHLTLEQFLICLSGTVSIIVDNGRKSIEINLQAMKFGVYIPPMIWSIQYKYSKDAVLLVLASDKYNSKDYIRDYKEFLALVKKKK